MTGRILYAWELGGNLGHIGQFLPLARRLRAGGAEVDCALAFTAGVARLLDPEGLSWMQAPVFRGVAPKTVNEPPLSYPDILLLLGYADEAALLGLVGAWRRLIELTRATLMIADHSPTAMLAARTLGLPVMLHVTGFYAPPDISPLPAMRPWASTPTAVLEASEARALHTINAVLAALGAAPLARIGQLFDVAEAGLNTLPELDPYPQRRNARYWGLLPSFAAAPVIWPPGRGPRIFGYLRAGPETTTATLAALAATPCRAVICCPNAPPEWQERFARPHLSIISQPVDLAQAGREADAAVLYAPHGTTASLLKSGVPMVLLPENLEQGLVAWRVQALGAGYMVGAHGRFADPATALEALLTSADCRTGAMAFARKYQDQVAESVLADMADRALRLAGAEGV